MRQVLGVLWKCLTVAGLPVSEFATPSFSIGLASEGYRLGMGRAAERAVLVEEQLCVALCKVWPGVTGI